MKNLLIAFMLTLLASCGSGGGSSSGSAGDPNNHGGSEEVFTYDIRIEGVAGASVTSNLVLNFGASDQSSNPVVVTLDASQLSGGTFFGRNIFWEVQSTSNNAVTVKILKDGVEVKSETLTVNGQVVTLTDNL